MLPTFTGASARTTKNEAHTSTQLVEAIKRLDLNETRRLLQIPIVDPNIPDEHGRTAIFHVLPHPDTYDSAFADNQDRSRVLCELLSNSRVRQTHQDNSGQTILLIIVKEGLEILLDKALPEANMKLVNLRDLDGRAPLSWATRHGPQMIARLIEAGAYVDTQDTNGRTPLSWAASYGAADSVEELLGHGVQVNLADHNGRTALSWAIDDFFLPTENGDNDTLIAPEHGRRTTQPSTVDKSLPLVRLLLHNKADVYSEKVLVNALMTHNPGVIDEIFRKVSLHRAIDCELANVVIHFFLDDRLKHVYPTIASDMDFRRRTLLHAAAEHGCRSIVKELLTRNADIDARDVNGNTPLKLSIRNGKVEIVEILLSNGAEVADLSGEDWLLCRISHGKEYTQGVVVLTEEGLIDGQPEAAKSLASQTDKKHQKMKRSFEIVRGIEDAKRPSGDRRRLFLGSHVAVVPQHLREMKWHKVPYEFEVARYKISDEGIHVGAWSPRAPRINDNFLYHISPVPLREDERGWCHEIPWSQSGSNKGDKPGSWGDYYSTLDHGYIPEDLLESFRLLIYSLKMDWQIHCSNIANELGSGRMGQMTKTMSGQMAFLAKLRQYSSEMGSLRSQHHRQVEWAKLLSTGVLGQYAGSCETMNTAIGAFSSDVREQLDLLDQNIRDMLQLEFAWVSLGEVKFSTSLATSMKRMSWVTFIFLPAIFASSLFGMNVDILESNPSWRWYFVVAGGLIGFTILIWLISIFILPTIQQRIWIWLRYGL